MSGNDPPTVDDGKISEWVAGVYWSSGRWNGVMRRDIACVCVCATNLERQR